MALNQAAYRFGSEDGTEATHGFLEALNTPISRNRIDQTTFLLRFLHQCDGGTIASNTVIQFQYQKNGGGFVNITTTSADVRAVSTTVFTNGANTTSRLGGSGTFETSSAGCTHDGSAGGTACDIVSNGRAESVCALQLVTADLAGGDVLEFRVSTSPTASVVQQTPQITITADTTVGVDTGSVGVSGADAQASLSAQLDVGGTVVAATDLAIANIVLVNLDTGAIVAAGSDLTALVRHILEAGATSVLGGDIQAPTALVLDQASVAVAGQDIEIPTGISLGLDTGAVSALGEDVGFFVSEAVELEIGGVVVSGSSIWAQPDVFWQEFTVKFAARQDFEVEFALVSTFEVAA